MALAQFRPASVVFSAASATADSVQLCLFDKDGAETRLPFHRTGEDSFALEVPGLKAGALYGLRADGPYDPDRGLWFDPDKLLVDPFALEIDRPYVFDPRLSLPRGSGIDTASLVPRARLVQPAEVAVRPPLFQPGGLIYELNVRGFTKLHPEVPAHLRGTVAALALPCIIRHLQALNVSAVELMPITAFIDERHLPPLGLSNAWGYNPASLMTLDPVRVPGGWAELAATTAALREAGIGVILDLVFNHTGESDRLGPTLSLRGLDNTRAYAHHPGEPGRLINDTGCGNTINCAEPIIQALVLESLRAFVRFAGVDGFRFDLGVVLGRGPQGFDPDAPLLTAMREDPLIGSRALIVEPWDLGPGGYQLGNFPAPFLEWNDRYRDDVRRFWRGDAGTAGALATRLCGSDDYFGKDGAQASRSVNFLAAHDGFTLADLVAYEHRHNAANGEQNRDGHGENFSWNHGVEGPSDDAAVTEARKADLRALLATLFLSRGTLLLCAGDEFGRTQGGNNNAYAQDNPISWLDWEGRDRDLQSFVCALSTTRKAAQAGPSRLIGTAFLHKDDQLAQIRWLTPGGEEMSPQDWTVTDILRLELKDEKGRRLSLCINRRARSVDGRLEASKVDEPAA